MSDVLCRLQAANPGLGIQPVSDSTFGPYGHILGDYDAGEMIARAEAIVPTSPDVVYEPSVGALEAPTALNWAIARQVYGGMPLQVGWCYGQNLQMDALEYHKGTEVLVCVTYAVLLVGHLGDVVYGDEITYDARKVAAFYAPAGSVVEFPSWTLHFAPIHVARGGQFLTLVYLPKGTNEPLTYSVPRVGESRLLMAVNKWLIAHPEAEGLVGDGAYVGISGDNIRVKPV